MGFWVTRRDGDGVGDAGAVEHCRHDIDDVALELMTLSTVSLMPAGQCTMRPSRVPPKCEATCFLFHWYGVFSASAQPTGAMGSCLGRRSRRGVDLGEHGLGVVDGTACRAGARPWCIDTTLPGGPVVAEKWINSM